MSAESLQEMSKTFKLPLLPGNTCGEELLRRNFRKTQLLSGSHEKHTLRRGVNLPIDFDSTLVSESTKMGTMSSTAESHAQPDSLARKVLRFYGYFTEQVQESAIERDRVRRAVICYFLEDDTLSASEPRQDNSGIPQQGSMVRRHQVPRQDNNGSVRFDQLAVGSSISFYGRTYHLVDCDAFTREFMSSIGVQMPEAQPYPDDKYTTVRAKQKEKKQSLESMSTTINASGMKVKLSFNEIRATKQFLQNDRKVLRFGAMWDDRSALYGSKHFFTLYYFLSDDTIEVVEKNENNSGRDPFPSFVRRQKMTKPRSATSKFENNSNMTFKETSGQTSYTDEDLRIGNTVWVFGRPLLIHSYDKFTQDFFREKYGINDYEPLDVSVPVNAPVKRIPPPYNGYGNEEDSLGSWYSLEPKPPRKDETKFVQFGNNVVKFALKLENNVPTDEIRKFVLSCFLADDSISIFEPIQRNSGIVGGKFLQRQKVVNPKTGSNFVATDFHVGKHTVINGYPFMVYASDERSLSYMEQNSSSFPMCDINLIINKLQAMLMSKHTGLAEAFHKADVEGSGRLDYKEMAKMLSDLSLDVTDQEVLTVLRYFDRNGDACISYEEFAARVMPEGAVVGKEERAWTSIFDETQELTSNTIAVKDRIEEQRDRVVNTTAAYAARAFLEAYAVRRALFHSEFRFVCDYSADSKIGAKEFRHTVSNKLKLGLNDTQLDALCEKFFPHGSRRVEYEEFLRLLNGTSNLHHNMQQLRDRR